MKPQIVIYCCANSTVAPEEHIEKVMSEHNAEIKLSRLPCSGRTDALYMLKAVEAGADMVLVFGCPEGQCQFLEGNTRAGKRVSYANKLLAEAGMGNERVRMYRLEPADGEQFVSALNEAVAKVMETGGARAAMKS